MRVMNRLPRTGLVLAMLVALTSSACGGGSAAPPQATGPVGGPPAPVTAASKETAPKLRLPRDTRPVSEAIELAIDPKQERFSGSVDITIALEHPRSVLWLHGKGLSVKKVSATALPRGTALAGVWHQEDDGGIASVRLDQPLPAGQAKLHIEYDAPWGPKLEGLHKIVQQGVPYAFTQFESIAARTAFPCFDEPGFKIPWDTTLVVPNGLEGIANTKEIERRPDGRAGSLRIHFAPTLPLPSYLLAFAVGPLEIVAAPDVPVSAVRKRPLPMRGVTTKGHGGEIKYALAHAGEILATLERYLGLEYPYDKLDIIAVPDKGGAMENAGAVTFADAFLLFDDQKAPLWQKQAYAGVVAHEFAHQWTGDLVTHAWWNDIWLNESFATWLGAKAADAWDPKSDGALQLLGGIQGAIGNDALSSARSIRQPIETNDDIENAFDSLTYQKGGGVLSMFERWLGAETFQRAVHDYLSKYASGNATADDFLTVTSAVTGKDVKAAFSTFLDQPGVPYIEATLRCDGSPRIHLQQSRYLPVGSTGSADRTWQVPVCARYQVGKQSKESCTLLTQRDGDMTLGGTCPDWIFPNADAAGYFRFALAANDLAALRAKGLASLGRRERVAYGNSLRAAYSRATLTMKDVLLAAIPLAPDPHPEIAREPMGFVQQAHEWFASDPLKGKVEDFAKRLFEAEGAGLGFQSGKTDDPDRIKLRVSVLQFLAHTARSASVRAEAKKRGLAFLGYPKDGQIHRDAVDANLAFLAMSVVGEDADRPLWDAVHAQLAKTEDAELRGHLLTMLTSARRPELLPLVRELTFDPVLRTTEVTDPLWSQLGEPTLRDETWTWIKANYDRILAALPSHHGRGQIISMGSVFCDEAHAKDVEDFFTAARVAAIEGGPRTLANTIEELHLCIAKRQKQEPSAREFFRAPPSIAAVR
jgi:alanyl aminopeptidase